MTSERLYFPFRLRPCPEPSGLPVLRSRGQHSLEVRRLDGRLAGSSLATVTEVRVRIYIPN